jgi:multiple sugar transport system substrate-binding protein
VNEYRLESLRLTRRQLLKTMGVGAVAMAAAPIVAACGGSSATSAPSASGGPAASASGRITIGSFQDPAMGPFRDKFIKQFQDETGIEVVYQESSYDAWYESAKRDGLNKVGAYDIYVMDDNWVPEFAAGEIVHSLDKLGFTPNPDIIPKGLEQGYWPPRSGPRLKAFKDATPELYALVIIDDVNLMYYNTDYVSAAPATWDDLEGVIKAKSNPPDLYGFAVRGAKGNPAVMTYLPFLNSYGGQFIKDDWTSGLDAPEAVAALARELSWLPYMSTSTPAFDASDMTALLMQGKCLAITDYTGTAVYGIDDPNSSKTVGKIGVATTPKQVKNGPAIGTFICGISSGSKNVEGAVKFLDWFTSDKIQLQFAQEGGSAAVTQKALTDPQAVAKYRWLPAVAESVANSTPKPRTPDEPKFEDILGTQINIALTTALSQKGGYDQIAKNALTEASTQINDFIQTNKDLYF